MKISCTFSLKQCYSTTLRAFAWSMYLAPLSASKEAVVLYWYFIVKFHICSSVLAVGGMLSSETNTLVRTAVQNAV